MSTKTKTTESKQQNKLDPRMDALLYGGDGKTGLTGMAYDLAQKPAINDRMRQGMDMQYNYLNSPLYSQIFNRLLSQGSAMTGKQAAGNPYTSKSGSMGFGSVGNYQPNYTPTQQAAPQMQAPPQIAQPQQPQQSQIDPQMLAFLQNLYKVNTNSGG